MTAGWYPDPSGRFEQRYHDGTQWTAHVSRTGLTFVDPTPVLPIPTPASGKPTSRKRARAIVALTSSALVVIAIALSIAVNRDDTPSATGPSTQPTTPPLWEVQCPGASSVFVEYRVLGTTTVASITYSTPNGGTAQHSDIAVPLKNLKGGDAISECYGSRDHLHISAQNSKPSGTVICTITRDGIEIAREQSNDASAIATCGR